MRHGFKIFDSDTHFSPMAETLEPYFDAAMRKRLPEWEGCKVPFRVGWAGEILEPPYRHRYQFKKRAGWREELRVLVTDFLGDSVLMYSSDYPHAESRFPESTNKVLAWKSLGDEVMRKMLWDNATRCFGEP